jgi:hypothetical protein
LEGERMRDGKRRRLVGERNRREGMGRKRGRGGR